MSKWPRETLEEVLRLYHEEGLTQQEISVKLGVDRGAVIRNLRKYSNTADLVRRKSKNLKGRSFKSNATRYSGLRKKIIDMFVESDKTISYIARNLSTSTNTVRRTVSNSGIFSENELSDIIKNRAIAKHIEKLASIEKKDVIDNGRYNNAKIPDWCTVVHKKGYFGEHCRVICENMNITEIPDGYVVHHVNNISKDNSFSNLVLMSRGDHTSLHRALRRKGVTTISKESTLKWVEARRKGADRETLDDIVCSGQECPAALKKAGTEQRPVLNTKELAKRPVRTQGSEPESQGIVHT